MEFSDMDSYEDEDEHEVPWNLVMMAAVPLLAKIMGRQGTVFILNR